MMMSKRQRNVFRLTRAFKYLALIVASISGFFFLGALRGAGISEVIAILWSVSLFVGASLSLYGTLKKQWTGEYVGLPMVIACLLLLAFSALLGTVTPARIFLLMIFLGFAFSTLARRSDVKFQKKIADYENRKKIGKPGL